MRSSYILLILCLLCLFQKPLLAADPDVDLLDNRTSEVTKKTVQDSQKAVKYVEKEKAPAGWTSQQYVDYYLKENDGCALAAWRHCYGDRLDESETSPNLNRRDAEGYLWSLQDLRANSYQWLPSMIRTSGYSVMNVGHFWGTKGVNSVSGISDAEIVENTTRPTMDEFVSGIKGSQHALFGMD